MIAVCRVFEVDLDPRKDPHRADPIRVQASGLDAVRNEAHNVLAERYPDKLLTVSFEQTPPGDKIRRLVAYVRTPAQAARKSVSFKASRLGNQR